MCYVLRVSVRACKYAGKTMHMVNIVRNIVRARGTLTRTGKLRKHGYSGFPVN